MARIYLASSWRNTSQPRVLAALRGAGHEVYDFRNPKPGDQGFSWRQVGYTSPWAPGDGQPGDVTLADLAQYRTALDHPRAREGFASDFGAMQWADTFVLLLPCGRSAHLEAGWGVGAGKRVHVLLSTEKFEPELMYLMCHGVHTELHRLILTLGDDAEVAAVAAARAAPAMLADQRRREDRAALWDDIERQVVNVRVALGSAPYRDAAPGMAALVRIVEAVTDPLGEPAGKCIHCGETMFGDDAESWGDETGHSACNRRAQERQWEAGIRGQCETCSGAITVADYEADNVTETDDGLRHTAICAPCNTCDEAIEPGQAFHRTSGGLCHDRCLGEGPHRRFFGEPEIAPAAATYGEG